MTTVYVLTIKTTKEVDYYTSIAALCKENSHDKIRVTAKHLYDVIPKKGFYENSRISIKKVKAKSTKDIQD